MYDKKPEPINSSLTEILSKHNFLVDLVLDPVQFPL